jgi:hypothetical protein
MTKPKDAHAAARSIPGFYAAVRICRNRGRDYGKFFVALKS